MYSWWLHVHTLYVLENEKIYELIRNFIPDQVNDLHLLIEFIVWSADWNVRICLLTKLYCEVIALKLVNFWQELPDYFRTLIIVSLSLIYRTLYVHKWIHSKKYINSYAFISNGNNVFISFSSAKSINSSLTWPVEWLHQYYIEK